MIPFNKPSIEGREIENILSSIERGKLGGNGYFTNLCHHHIENTIGAQKVLLTSSGTDALEMCALLCGIKPGDEVIMPSYTFVSTANAFCMWGALPVFVDIRPEDMNIDPGLIEASVTERTRAVVVVHYAGIPCDMETICAVAKKHNLFVIEDAAHAYLSLLNEEYLGTIGDFGVFSFHETKNFICGEGGAILINREENIPRAEIVWEKGTNRAQFFRGEADKYTWMDLGSSYLPNELTAAFLYGQLEAQDTILKKRKKIFEYYDSLLSPLTERGLIQTPVIPENVRINYHMYYIITKDHQTQRDLLSYLRKAKIAAVFHYVPLHSAPYAKKLGISVTLPVTESISGRLIRMPFYNSITNREMDFIAKKIYQFFKV